MKNRRLLFPIDGMTEKEHQVVTQIPHSTVEVRRMVVGGSFLFLFKCVLLDFS